MEPTEQDMQRLLELLSRGWDDTLTDEDNAEINAFLESRGAESGEMLLKATAIHFEIVKHVNSTEAYDQAMAKIKSAALADHVDPTPELTAAPQTSKRPHSSLVRQGWFISAVAASLLVAIGLQYFGQQPSPSPAPTVQVPRLTRLLRPSKPVGSLVGVNQAVWVKGTALTVGQTIEENRRLELASGSAQISMACGADIVIQGPCSITLVADDLANLELGKLTAQAAKWATGFTVTTNDLTVTDLGTRFAVSVDDAGIIEAHVLEGSVIVSPLNERLPRLSSKLLNSGQAIRVDGIRSKVDLIDARREEFIDKFERFRPLRPIAIWNSGMGAAIGAEDPHWRITSGSNEFDPYPRKAFITEGDTQSYEDNRPKVSQWLSVHKEFYPGAPPESLHTFETSFDLTGFDLDTVYVVGYFLVDDAINELRINGHPVEFTRWVTTWDVFDFKSFHPIEITNHFVAGENIISIDVYNSPSNPNTPEDFNPTALRVEWQAFGCATEE